MAWPVFELGEFCDTKLGKALNGKAQSGSDTWPYLRNINVRWGSFDLSDIKQMYFTERERNTLRVEYGDLLICEGGEVGRCAIWREQSGEYYFQNAIHRVRPDPARCITDFLYYQMRFKAQTGGLREFTTQATIAHLSGEKLSKLPIILPPLAEQQRIVEILDRAAAIQRLRRAAEEKAREIIPALFVDMFGDPATNPKGWPVATLAQLARFISGGTPAKLNSAYWSGDVPWVSPKDMKVWSIDDAQDHISERVFLETNIKKIDAGAVLIVVRGMILAHTVPVAINERRIAVNQDMKAIVPSSKVLPYFLLWALRTRHHELLSVVGTAAHGTKKIDTEHLERFAILVPPIELQRRFAQIVENEKGRIALSKAATVTAGQMQISLSKKLLG